MEETLATHVARTEREAIAEALEQTGDNLSLVARTLGMSRGALYKTMAAFRLQRPKRTSDRN